MKEFLVYNNDNILVTTDGSYVDFYDTKEDKEISIIENLCYETEDEATLDFTIIEPSLEDLRFLRKEKELYGDTIKNSTKKEYLEGNFDYIDEFPVEINKKVKEKKQKKIKENKFSKIPLLNYFLTFIYFCLKVIILFVFSFMIFCTIRYSETNEYFEQELIETITPTPVVTEIPNDEIFDSPEKVIFKETMIDKAIELNSIIEGEKECIKKLSSNLISLYDASIYFDKTQQRKEDILENFYEGNIREDFYDIQNELKEIYIQSINLSKQIKIHYNNSSNKTNAINDFESFTYKHNQRIDDYEIMLEDF